jgi:hypothetical protein
MTDKTTCTLNAVGTCSGSLSTSLTKLGGPSCGRACGLSHHSSGFFGCAYLHHVALRRRYTVLVNLQCSRTNYLHTFVPWQVPCAYPTSVHSNAHFGPPPSSTRHCLPHPLRRSAVRANHPPGRLSLKAPRRHPFKVCQHVMMRLFQWLVVLGRAISRQPVGFGHTLCHVSSQATPLCMVLGTQSRMRTSHSLIESKLSLRAPKCTT